MKTALTLYIESKNNFPFIMYHEIENSSQRLLLITWEYQGST